MVSDSFNCTHLAVSIPSGRQMDISGQTFNFIKDILHDQLTFLQVSSILEKMYEIPMPKQLLPNNDPDKNRYTKFFFLVARSDFLLLNLMEILSKTY